MSWIRESGCRTGWVAGDAVRALMRHRLILVGLAGALLLVMAGQVLRTIDFGGAPERFLVDFSFAALALFGSGLAVIGTAQLVFADRESGATAMILAKPVRPLEYLLGQWAGIMLVLGFLCGGVAVLVMVMASRPAVALEQWGEAPALVAVPWGAVLATAGAQWLKFGVVVAGTILVASYSRSSLFTILLTATLLVVAYLRTAAQNYYGSKGGLAGVGQVALQLFEMADRITTVGAAPIFPALLILAAYAAVYAGAFLGLAGWIFRRRDG